MNAQDQFRKVLDYPFALGLLAFALILAIVFIVRGLGIDELDAKVFDISKTRDTLSANRKNSTGLLDDLETLDTLTEKVDARSMVSEERSANIAYFYELDEKTAVSMTSVAQDPKIEPDKKNTYFTALKSRAIVPFSISVTGTFQEALTYLSMIHRGNKIAQVRRITIATNSQLDGTVEVDLKIHVFGEEAG
ncbi:MAG: hypothetical protein AAF212_10775 [Verrucomicrobiota bacterium]